MIDMEPVNNAVNYMVDYNGSKVSYIKYVWDVIGNKRESVLDTFGEYDSEIPNELIDVHTKVFLWLEYILNDKKAREAMVMTCSELCVEDLEDLVAAYIKGSEDSQFDIVQLYNELYDTMFNYLDGC